MYVCNRVCVRASLIQSIVTDYIVFETHLLRQDASVSKRLDTDDCSYRQRTSSIRVRLSDDETVHAVTTGE